MIPALAVARELKRRGHEPFFVGTAAGLEAKLVPGGRLRDRVVEIGGLKRVGLARTARTLVQLPLATARMVAPIGPLASAAVFSMGGYAAGPVVLAAVMRRIPMVLMEPNAMPGMTNRWIGRVAGRALVNFEETTATFRAERPELTGIPVRPEFFALPPKPRGEPFTVLITGGSRGSRTLNNAARESWPLFRNAGFRVRLVHQTGREAYAEIARDFASSGVEGEVAPFIEDMPAAFAAADLVVSRSGAGAVAEIAAAGKASILVPFPFAADDHQTRNAEALARAGAARLVADREFTGKRLFDEVGALASSPRPRANRRGGTEVRPAGGGRARGGYSGGTGRLKPAPQHDFG